MNKYVYQYSKNAAEHDGDSTVWLESYRANKACAKAIMDEIELIPDGTRLSADSVKRVINRFGYDRVNWVLAATIQQISADNGVSQENKDWAREYFMSYHKKEIEDYRVNADPTKFESFVISAREEYDSLNLFDYKHCLPDSGIIDYKDRVLLLRPTNLNDEHKTPDNQLFIADIGGFGCSPGSSGRRIVGHFLIDGEKGEYYRSDFIGIIADELLPQWAKDTLEQLQNPSISMEQTMSSP